MKIVIIGQKGIPAISGGVETHVEELAKRLVKSGHEVVAYTRHNYTDKNLKEFEGVRLIGLPSISSKNLDAIVHTFLSVLHLIFIERRVDVVHFHSIGPSSLLWIVKIMKPLTPVVATFHTQCYIHKKWGGFAKTYLKFGELVANKVADEVIAISRNLQRYAQEKYHNLVNYIPNGVGIASPKEADIIQKWGLTKDNYIVSISRLVRHKGIHYIIEAYKGLNTDKKLVIVGDGSYTDEYVGEIKELAKGNDNIIFTGLQSGDTLRELFSNSYLFVQASESEGLSIALLEAMSYGQAVLSSDIPENEEAVRSAGFYFKNKDVASLRQELEKLLANKALVDSKKDQGLARVKLNYDWDTIVRETIRVYEKAIENKRFIVSRRKVSVVS
jgi:glycosyltransferase involved in cell wall biosynthesis